MNQSEYATAIACREVMKSLVRLLESPAGEMRCGGPLMAMAKDMVGLLDKLNRQIRENPQEG